MQVDHFNPTLKKLARHSYANLHLSSSHCNRHKSDYWPSVAERRRGIYLIDPCAEQDYGKHIFEDPETFQLIGVTPAGRYHIDILDLNAPTFVDERRHRAEIAKRCSSPMLFKKGGWSKMMKDIEAVLPYVDALIPYIPPIPAHFANRK